MQYQYLEFKPNENFTISENAINFHNNQAVYKHPNMDP